jgi:hypothetical protein
VIGTAQAIVKRATRAIKMKERMLKEREVLVLIVRIG